MTTLAQIKRDIDKLSEQVKERETKMFGPWSADQLSGKLYWMAYRLERGEYSEADAPIARKIVKLCGTGFDGAFGLCIGNDVVEATPAPPCPSETFSWLFPVFPHNGHAVADMLLQHPHIAPDRGTEPLQ